MFDSQDRSRSNALSSPVHYIVSESLRALDYSQSEVVLMDSRPEAEADSNKISTRAHNPGLDLAPNAVSQLYMLGLVDFGMPPQHGQSGWIMYRKRTITMIITNNYNYIYN